MLVSSSSLLFAQHILTLEQKSDKMVAAKIWKPFVLSHSYKAFGDKKYNFSKHQNPIFLYVGQRACITCSLEFPIYVRTAKAFPNVDFVYLTPDDSAVIQKKFGNSLKLSNMYVLQIPMQELWDKDIAKVFPVKYFIDQKDTVVNAVTGGFLRNQSALMAKWNQELTTLLDRKNE